MEGINYQRQQEQGYYPLQGQITYPPQQQYQPVQQYEPPQQYQPPQQYSAEQQYQPEQQYPPQQGLTPQGGYESAPPYFPPVQQQPYLPPDQAVPVTQQQTTNVVVVQSQPTLGAGRTVMPFTGNHYLTLSIVMTFICFFFGWHSLFCTIPAIIFAISARDAEAHGDMEGAQTKARIALILNIASVVWWFIPVVVVIIIAGSS